MTDEVIRVQHVKGRWGPIGLVTGKSYRLELERPASELVRLTGMFFDTENAFLLPAALPGLQRLVRLYESGAAHEVLVVGHTDASGSQAYNLHLSLQRAKSVAAYLRDDVTSWLDYYELEEHDERWGQKEDAYMLGSLPQERGLPYLHGSVTFADAVEEFQRDAGLEVTRAVDEQTRRALIEAYMSIDGTTLPDATRVVCHGCGESFPTGISPSAHNERDRRVELFFFADAIDPDPKTETSTKGASPYPEWLAAVTTTHELVVDVDDNLLELLLVDEDLQPMANTPFVVRIPGSAPVIGHADARGIATFSTPAICSDHVAVSWGGPGRDRGYEYHRRVFIECADGSEDAQLRRKLHNLGYSPNLGFDAAVRAFQAERNVNCDPLPIGAPNDLLPPDTKAALDAAFAELSTKGGNG